LYFYKDNLNFLILSIIDTCQNESDLNTYQKTINLGIAQGVPATTMVLIIDGFEDESADFVPEQHYIFRGSTPDDMFLYDSVVTGTTLYNDEDITDLYYYKIGIVKESGCETGSKALYGSSVSNIINNNGLVGVKEINIDSGIEIYPNPLKESTMIKIPVTEALEVTDVRVTDLTGKIVFEDKFSGSTYLLNRGTLESGVYFLEISAKGEEKLFRGKLVVK